MVDGTGAGARELLLLDERRAVPRPGPRQRGRHHQEQTTAYSVLCALGIRNI